jgi:DNA-directed RNA polymerase specialized sigma24 family protein
VFFLRERRAQALGRPAAETGDAADDALAGVASPDPMDERFESDWRAATVRECLGRIGRRNAEWRTALDADLRRDGESDAEIAARLGWTVDAFRSVLKRARAAFRDLYRIEERRLDGFGGEEFRAA